MDPATFTRALISVATDFVGLVEVESNATWDDPTTAPVEVEKSRLLSSTMSLYGWDPGEPYCAGLLGAVVTLACRKLGLDDTEFRRIWTAHCMTNVRKFARLKLLDPATAPTEGALMLMRRGDTENGHAAIVQAVDGLYPNRTLATVEGNTSRTLKGSQRQGDGIFTKVRNVNRNGDLITQGFVSVKALLTLLKVK